MAAIVANKMCIPFVILVLECVLCAPPGPDRVRIKGTLHFFGNRLIFQVPKS